MQEGGRNLRNLKIGQPKIRCVLLGAKGCMFELWNFIGAVEDYAIDSRVEYEFSIPSFGKRTRDLLMY